MTKKPQEIHLECKDEKEYDRLVASLCLSPDVDSTIILSTIKKDFKPKFEVLRQAVQDEVDKVAKGDISAIEKMLMAQAYTLQAIFTDSINKAVNCQNLNQLQIYSKVALKAQNQCRQTLAALAEIKNPSRTTFIKNTATNQQVNFNQDSPENFLNKPNELLTGNNYETLDIAGTTTASGVNQKMATLEA